MPRWVIYQAFYLLCLGAVLPLTHKSRFISPFRKRACSSLITMTYGDLEGVVVKPSDQYTSTTLILLFKDPKQRVAVCQTRLWSHHHLLWIPNCLVKELDLETASVAHLKLGCWKDAETAVAVKAERAFQIG